MGDATNDDAVFRIDRDDEAGSGRHSTAAISGSGIEISRRSLFSGGTTSIAGGSIDASRGGLGAAPQGPAISGRSDTVGVLGIASNSPSSVGVIGRSPHGTGVTAEGPTALRAIGRRRGIRASGRRGASFSGKAAQLKLAPAAAETHPRRGQRGDLFVDRNGRLWFCKGNTRWRQLA